MMKSTNKTKILVTMVTAISGGGLLYTAQYEGYTPKATIPVKGDVPTIGHGTTVYCNGKKVTMEDPSITKDEALRQLKCHIEKSSPEFNKSLSGVKLSQTEYDLYMDFTYQFGINAWKGSSMLRNLKQSEYVQACESLLKWKYVAKRDCSIRSNGCYGVWTRQLDRYNTCMGENK